MSKILSSMYKGYANWKFTPKPIRGPLLKWLWISVKHR